MSDERYRTCGDSHGERSGGFFLCVCVCSPAISLGFTTFGWGFCVCDRFLIQPLRQSHSVFVNERSGLKSFLLACLPCSGQRIEVMIYGENCLDGLVPKTFTLNMRACNFQSQPSHTSEILLLLLLCSQLDLWGSPFWVRFLRMWPFLIQPLR